MNFRTAWREATCGRQRYLAVIAALTAVATLLYFPSLHAPWYLDDYSAILENPPIRDLVGSLRGIFLQRGLALFTFALNYRFGGVEPFGYHLVNLGLHISCGLLVYLLLQKALRDSMLLPALGALLFVAHPLQTQAVTYVVQRMAVLATLLFLLAIWLFVLARERLAAGRPFAAAGHLGYYLGALLAGLFAVFTKENTAVLPVALYLYARFFLPPAHDRRRLLLSLLPFAVAPLWVAAMRLAVPLAGGLTLVQITRTTDLERFQQLSPLRYLVTEFSVLWVYLRLLFLPYGQALDHNYPVARSLLELRHLIAGGGLVLLGVAAMQLRHRQPLIAAGLAWFFLTLAVESSFIPLDPLFEHRLYLPMFGFVLVLLGLLRLLPGKRTAALLLAATVLVCLPLSWQRNRLWADPVAFYTDNLTIAPGSERVLVDLAFRYFQDGRTTEAEQLLLRALSYNPDSLAAHITLVAVYNEQRRLPEAIALAKEGLAKYPRSDKLLSYLGGLYYNSGDYAAALQVLDRELELHPNYAPAKTYRAKTLVKLGRWAEAETGLRQALTFDAEDLALHNDLGIALIQQGRDQEAEAEWRSVLARDPQNQDAIFYLGLLAANRGEHTTAASMVQRLQAIDPQRARALQETAR